MTKEALDPAPKRHRPKRSAAVYQVVQNTIVLHEAGTAHDANVWAAENRITGALIEIDLDGYPHFVRSYKKGE